MVTFCLMMRPSSSSLFELRKVMLLLYQKQFVYLSFYLFSHIQWAALGQSASIFRKKIILPARIGCIFLQVWLINALFSVKVCIIFFFFFFAISRYRRCILLRERKRTLWPLCCKDRAEWWCLSEPLSLPFSPDCFMREIKLREGHEQHVSQNLNWSLFLLLQPIMRLYLSWDVGHPL